GRRVPGRGQHPRRRGGGGAQGARDALAPHRPLLRRRGRRARRRLPADALPALRTRTVRVRLPGQRDGALPGRAERDGLQPLHRHAVLLEQLPVQGPALQLVRLQRGDAGDRGAPEEPGRDRPCAGRHGEVHLLRAADPARTDRRGGRGAAGPAGRGPDRVPADVPDRGDRLRLAHRPGRAAPPAAPRPPALRRPPRARHPPPLPVPRDAHEPGARGRPESPLTMGHAPAPALPHAPSADEPPVLLGRPTDAELTDRLLAPLRSRARAWWLLVALAAGGTLLFIAMSVYTFVAGIGLWGNNIPVAWAYAITNFVWWIG